MILKFEDYVKTDDFEQDQAAQDQLIADNRRSIEELEVTKGPVARYTCKGTSFNVASRNGDLYVSDATAANVTAISFAPFDLNGNPTRPVSAGGHRRICRERQPQVSWAGFSVPGCQR